MKTLKLSSVLLFIIINCFFAGCTREPLAYISTTKEIISQGKWSVDYYFSGQDKTAQFSNYQFIFTGNGTVTASDSGHSYTGTWSMVTGVNRNEILKINLDHVPDLQELNNQWSVDDKSSNWVSMNLNGNELRFKKL